MADLSRLLAGESCEGRRTALDALTRLDDAIVSPHVPVVRARAALGASAFSAFHGMLCGPAIAARCVDSFNGTILFMPSTYEPDKFRNHRERLPHEVKSLTLLKYYALVLFSLTGLCSMLRQTETLDANEDAAALAASDDCGANRDHPLRVHPIVIHALASRHGSAQLVRRFEYRFRLLGLHVCMYHFRGRVDGSQQDSLSLVEVYKFGWREMWPMVWQ